MDRCSNIIKREDIHPLSNLSHQLASRSHSIPLWSPRITSSPPSSPTLLSLSQSFTSQKPIKPPTLTSPKAGLDAQAPPPRLPKFNPKFQTLLVLTALNFGKERGRDIYKHTLKPQHISIHLNQYFWKLIIRTWEGLLAVKKLIQTKEHGLKKKMIG